MSLPPPLQQHKRTVNWGGGQFITCSFCPIHTLPLLQHETAPMGDGPEWLPSSGCSTLGTDWPRGGPTLVHKSCQQPAPAESSLSSWVHRSCQKHVPAWTSHRVTVSSRHSPALAWGLRNSLLHTRVFATDCRGISAPAPPPSLTLLFFSHFLTYFHSSHQLLLRSKFFPFLNLLSQRCYCHGRPHRPK